jgi:hypothetical protein
LLQFASVASSELARRFFAFQLAPTCSQSPCLWEMPIFYLQYGKWNQGLLYAKSLSHQGAGLSGTKK